jgi:amino acid transporter
MGLGALVTESVVSSSPQTVLVGGIPTMVALGVPGVPLAFVAVMLVLRLLFVGPTAVARHVKHGAPFYAQLAQGWGPTAGLMAAGVGLVGYNCLQISLYLLVGNTMTLLAPGVPWWVWAFVAWLLVMASGHYPGHVVARTLGLLLGIEVTLIVFFILAGFTHPAGGHIPMQVWQPSGLMAAGAAGAVGGVLVFAFASNAGLESVLAFGEEAKTSKAMSWAPRLAGTACGVLYALAAWAYLSWIGVRHLVDAALPGKQPLVLLGDTFGQGIYRMAIVFLVTSALGAAISFHGGIARQVFALAREGVLSRRWDKVTEGKEGGAPLGGTFVQATVAAVVLVVCAVAGFAPMNAFVWLSAVGAFCVLLLLVAASGSARSFFAKGRGTSESVWQRQAGPFLGTVFGVIALVFMASNLDKLLGTPDGSSLPWLVAAPVGSAILAGAGAGVWLRRARPQVYAGIGYGAPDPQLVRDQRLGAIRL